MSDELPGRQSRSSEKTALATATSELPRLETLAEIAEWIARWSGILAGAQRAFVWTADISNPRFVCTGAWGDGSAGTLRSTIPRETGVARDLIRSRSETLYGQAQILASKDAWFAGATVDAEACVAIPIEAGGEIPGLIALFFREAPELASIREALAAFLRDAGLVLARVAVSAQKTSGLLHAIERLTNLYDLSRAFASTLDWEELTEIIAHKAADFGRGEVASLWILEGDEGEVALAATAVNENYDVENAPAAVGGSIIGDLIADQEGIVENGLPSDHPLRQENDSYDVQSVLAVPLLEDESPVGAIVVANKRGRHPQFSDVDKELLNELGRRAVRALRNARLYRAEQKVEQLDALLAVSREITSTLDMDRVMTTIVNSASALVTFDRCAIAVVRKGKLRVGAISGMKEINRSDESVKRTEELLEWVFYGGSDVHVAENEDGSIDSDRLETEEKFRAFFKESGMRSFHSVLLQDDEGKLGVVAFESQEPLLFDEETRDLLQILVNQTTVALRNAQLYQRVPLAGFWKPLMETQRKLAELPGKRKKRWAYGLVIAAIVMIAVPWNIRLTGTARVVPGRRLAVTPMVDGVVRTVRHREGDLVPAGEILATLDDEPYRAALAEARSAADIAESEVARATTEGNASGAAAALARRDVAAAKLEFAQKNLASTEIRSPVSGVLVTRHLENRIGQVIKGGGDFAVIADLTRTSAEIAIPEYDAYLLRTGQIARLKPNAYPDRVFRGKVTRLGAEMHEEGDERFLIVEAEIDDPGHFLKVGMLGKAKISTGTRSLGYAFFRKSIRFLWAKFWPLLP